RVMSPIFLQRQLEAGGILTEAERVAGFKFGPFEDLVEIELIDQSGGLCGIHLHRYAALGRAEMMHPAGIEVALISDQRAGTAIEIECGAGEQFRPPLPFVCDTAGLDLD